MRATAEQRFPVRLELNGRSREGLAEPRTQLCDFLRHDLGATGVHVGCEHGVCGACTVLVDGVPARACVIPAQGVAGRNITTLEGLPARCGSGAALHPVQQAFVQAQAAQCGYCLNGMVMMAVDLLERDPDPDEAAIRRALSGNLCRCGTHVQILRAVQRAAELMRQTPP